MTEYLSDLYVGERAAGISVPPKFDAISKVVLLVDDENYYEAGNGTGRTLELTCPYGTQEMANNILASVSGYQYQPVTATDALADPAVELGDSMTVGGAYSIVAQREIDFGLLLPMGLAAPGQEEIESEYPYVSQQQSDINRQLADTRSEIAKNSEQIQLTVEGLNSANQAISQLTLSIDSIELSVSNGSTSSTITLKKDNVVVSSQEITMSGLVTFTGLANGTTTINGACIKTGTIDADRINLTGAISFSDLSTSVQNDINDAYSMAEDAQTAVGEISSTVDDWSYRYGGRTYIDGTQIMAGTVTASTLQGGSVELLNGSGSTSGVLTLGSASSSSYAVDLTSYAALRLVAKSGNLYLQGGPRIACDCTVFHPMGSAPDLGSTSYGMWQEVFAYTAEINTSDENWKNSIEELPEKYLTMMDAITPVRYKMNNGSSNRYHTGFISQNVKAAMDAAGVSDLDFAGWCKDVDAEGNDIYLLRYSEFISILWAKIKQLEGRIAMLEAS